MKLLSYSLLASLGLIVLIRADESHLAEDLQKIQGVESSQESKRLLSEFDFSSDAGFSLIVQRADATENKDLLNLVRRKIESEDWTKQRTWKEGLQMSSRFREGLAIIAKRDPVIKSKLKSYFLNSPDVPYETVTDWHSGYGYRGLQGAILKIMAENDTESFKEIVGFLDKESISISKKRTIVWAMRYDKSGFSETILKEKKIMHGDIPKKEIEDTLKVFEKTSN